MIVTVTPAPAIDHTYLVDEPLSDELTRAREAIVEPSGKGVNVSAALARAGCATSAVVVAGGATGRLLVDLLTDAGIAHRVVRSGLPTRVNTTVVARDRVLKVNAPAPYLTDGERAALVEVCASALAPGDTMVLAGRVAGAVHLVTDLAVAARSRGAGFAVDSSGDALHAAIRANAELLAPNLDELCGVDAGARAVLTRPASDRPLIAARHAAVLARRTGGQVLLSLGADGAVWTDGAESWHAVVREVAVVNAVGAGDALLAGFLAEGNAAPADRLRTGTAWSAAACRIPTSTGDLAARADPSGVVMTELHEFAASRQ